MKRELETYWVSLITSRSRRVVFDAVHQLPNCFGVVVIQVTSIPRASYCLMFSRFASSC
jgi:hypothetical protein